MSAGEKNKSEEKGKNIKIKKAYFAGGCFWGVEYYMQQQKGVIDAITGYMGGTKPNPTYKEVCSGKYHFYETVEVIYNTQKTNYETLAKIFFEIHDPTQKNGQGPDIGEQYESVIFYSNVEERDIANKLIDILKKNGLNVVTKVIPVTNFYKAEDYHQDYYFKKNKVPYCHIYKKRF